MSIEIVQEGVYEVTVTLSPAYAISVTPAASYTIEVVEPTAYSIGVNGTQGPPGAQGPQGIQGIQGPAGANGTIGVDGKSAYEIWLEEGNTGTEQDFLDSLVGEDGAQGAPGVAIDFIQNTTPTGTGTSSIPAGALWFHTNSGIQYTYFNDGNTYQWVQETLPLGPQGPQGANGTNIVNGSTATTFTGLLKGNGSVISATTVLTEIGFTPENVANKENTTLDTSSTKYPTNNLVKTSLDSFADDVDYAIMTNQRILFNF
jgi:hypothetical protein